MRLMLPLCLLFLLISCKSKEEENWDDLQKIKVGMTYNHVNVIMRHAPKSVEVAFWNDSLFVCYYDSAFGSSDDYRIVFSKKDSTVVEIGYGD